MNIKESKKRLIDMKIKKEKNVIFLILFIITIIACSAFLKPHYTSDTYRIIHDGYEFYSYDKFMKEARPITAILTMIMGIFNIPIEIYIVASFIISIILLNISVVELYEILKGTDKELKYTQKIMLVLISYIIIFNYLTIEHILFLEAAIMSLGILLSILACKIIVSKETYCWLKAVLLLFIGVFCYQGSIAIFPMIILTYYAVKEKINIKEYAKITIKSAIIYGILMLSTVLYSKLIFGGSRIQISADSVNITDLFNAFKQIVIYSLNVIPAFTHIAIVLSTIICLMFIDKSRIKEKIAIIGKYIFIILASVAICIMPTIMGAGLDIEPRMSIAYASTIGISIFFLYNCIGKQTKKNILNIILFIITIILFVLTIILYNTLTFQNIQTNKKDAEICKEIENIIVQYEKDTGIKVEYIAAVQANKSKGYEKGTIKTRAYNKRATADWALRETIIYYTKKNMNFAGITREQYIEYFNYKEWEEFSEEQVVIIGNIMYFCGN